LVAQISAAYPDLPNARWVAMRLLGGDESLSAAMRDGTLGNLALTRAKGIEESVSA
jgi:GTPase